MKQNVPNFMDSLIFFLYKFAKSLWILMFKRLNLLYLSFTEENFFIAWVPKIVSLILDTSIFYDSRQE